MLPKFALAQPACLEEACALKAAGGKVFAGGTDVFVSMHNGDLRPETLVDLKGIQALSGLSFDPERGARIGALTPHRQVEHWAEGKKYYTALAEGCSSVGSVQTRTRGTVGGNLCNAAPSGDSIGPLFALDAQVEIAGRNGRRMLGVQDFFTGPKRTVLGADELLCAIHLPPPPASGSAYYKYARRNAMDLALIALAAFVRMENGKIAEARVALSTCAPTVIRCPAAEEFLQGREPGAEAFREAGRLAVEEASPRTSWRASKEFRLKLIENLLPAVLERTAGRARGEGGKG